VILITDKIGVTDRGLERMAVHLYVGWGPGTAWASLSADEQDSWKRAAASLLDAAFEDQES